MKTLNTIEIKNIAGGEGKCFCDGMLVEENVYAWDDCRGTCCVVNDFKEYKSWKYIAHRNIPNKKKEGVCGYVKRNIPKKSMCATSNSMSCATQGFIDNFYETTII